MLTFTRAARDELIDRIANDDTYDLIRGSVEITTLNAWGYRRLRNVAFRHRLLTSDRDKHFAMENQLQHIWRQYGSIENAIRRRNGRRNTNPTNELMNSLDTFKSLGYDHLRHRTLKEFTAQWQRLSQQGLNYKLDEITHRLVQIGVLENDGPLFGQQQSPQMIWDRFFKFWLDATRHLSETATFSFEDQKYIAHLDERSKLENGDLLGGAASYNHVLVDEFQDSNPLDVLLVRAISERNGASLTIAGDDDQAVYEWRGATIDFILDPDRHIGRQFRTHTLGVNYRSPSNIVEHSQQLISHNRKRVRKNIRAYDNSPTNQAQIEVKYVNSLAMSLEYVHNVVENNIKDGKSPSKVALISRKRSQIIPFQIYFASQHIPFCAAEDLHVFLSNTFENLLNLMSIKERSTQRQRTGRAIDDLLALCNLIMRFPLNRTNAQALRAHLQLDRPNDTMSALDSLYPGDDIAKVGTLKSELRHRMFRAVGNFFEAGSVSEALHSLSQHFAGLQYDFGKSADDIFYADPPFLYLSEYAKRYGDDYSRFVDDIELAKETLVSVPPFDDESTEYLIDHPVHLMTAYRAKGKEFDSVVLLDANDGIWPSKSAETEAQLEAERRVFYVAFTRARKHIAIMVDPSQPPSPFIEELGLKI